MLNLDPTKLLLIAVVAVILLGPDKLPQMARQAGAAWRTFNEYRQKMETEVRKAVPDLPSTQEISRLARSPSALLNHLSASADGIPDDASATAGSSSAVAAPISDEVSEVAAPPPEASLPPEKIVFSDPHLN